MTEHVYFMALGGAQEIGASCYYLRLGQHNIILDAGTGQKEGAVYRPDFYSLLTSPFLQSLNQIQQIYISHAHADHVGALPFLMHSAPHSDVYMTAPTAILSEYQLYDRNRYLFSQKGEAQRLLTQSLLERITTVSFLHPFSFGSYQVDFYPAGHIPGAMMTLFTFGKRRILYTGDISLEETPLAQACLIPKDEIDTLILCGLHARHPHYQRPAGMIEQKAQKVLDMVHRYHRSVLCQMSQLSKGIEFIKLLNQYNHNHIPIYVDSGILQVAEKMERLGIPILSGSGLVMGAQPPGTPHVFLTDRQIPELEGFYRQVRIDFTLHADYRDLSELIRRINPRQTVIVHCAPSDIPGLPTIEQELMLDGDCRTQFMFAESKEIYQLI